MKLFVFSLLIIFLPAVVYSQSLSSQWVTPYESSGYKKTPRYDETMQYCRKLAKASPWVHIGSFGTSPEGRDMPLIIVSKDKIFTAAKAQKSGKAIVLIQNGIHAGEIDGKDASLMLIRDIAVTKTKASLLDHVILLVIPFYNVDGHERFSPYNRINQNGPEEMGWRVTAQNLNLNRDYMKADAPETQAWLKLYMAWLPDFLVDCHVTDGADFQYVVTYTVETHENLAAPVRSWVKNNYIPSVTAKMEAMSMPIVPYVNLRDNKDLSKGLDGGAAPPRFSTSYAALQNRPALLVETHMLKDYKTRVDGTYKILTATLEILNRDFKILRSAILDADKLTVEKLDNPFPLSFNQVDAPNETIHFLGYKAKIEKSDISGADKVVWTHDPLNIDIPRFDSVKVAVSVTPPVAYLIPPQWDEVIRRLQLHGVIFLKLKQPVELEVEMYKFSKPKWQQNPYEGHHPVTYSVNASTEKRTIPARTMIARTNQRAARVLINALEPQAPDAFVAWGFFDAIFEQKEYAEGYVLEQLAPQMLMKDSLLKIEFEKKLQADTAFAHSPYARLNFFYQRSPYWDKNLNVYPVARLMKDTTLPVQ
ncbi:MAG: M14 family metallopeptidase [Bacteroidota bacterium]